MTAIPFGAIAKLAEVYGRSIDHFTMPDPPPPKKKDALPVFFLRTRPGVKVDEKTHQRLLEIVEAANNSRGK